MAHVTGAPKTHGMRGAPKCLTAGTRNYPQHGVARYLELYETDQLRNAA